MGAASGARGEGSRGGGGASASGQPAASPVPDAGIGYGKSPPPTTDPGSDGDAGWDSGSAVGDPGFPLGTTCTMDSECASGLCKSVIANGDPVCVTPCSEQSDCGLASTFFCNPVTAGSTTGYCVPRSPAHCMSCGTDKDCGSLSEVCAKGPNDTDLACHVDCSLAGSAACPNDYACVEVTVNGAARQVCQPKLDLNCLEAVGGFCERVGAPQSCVHRNSVGTCVGQRVCLPGTKRYDSCGAEAPSCKGNCTVTDPAGCVAALCAGVTSTVDNCGGCGRRCPGVLAPNANVACAHGSECRFSCQGENYDANGDASDGCEAPDDPLNNHSVGSAVSFGDIDCVDASSPVRMTTDGRMLSDNRVHEAPSIAGFDAATGSAPDYFSIQATGGFSCVNDLGLDFSVKGSSHPTCYHVALTAPGVRTYEAQTDARGIATITSGSGSYHSNTRLIIAVSKTCKANSSEAVTYTLTGHL